jgi:hypothetical protein
MYAVLRIQYYWGVASSLLSVTVSPRRNPERQGNMLYEKDEKRMFGLTHARRKKDRKEVAFSSHKPSDKER